MGAFVIPIQVRNMVSTGPQMLYLHRRSSTRFTQSLIKTVVASYFMVMGDPIFPLGVWEGLLAAFILAACWLAFQGWRRGACGLTPGEFLPQALGWIGLFLHRVRGGHLHCAHDYHLAVTRRARYYLPVYPLVLARPRGRNVAGSPEWIAFGDRSNGIGRPRARELYLRVQAKHSAARSGRSGTP